MAGIRRWSATANWATGQIAARDSRWKFRSDLRRWDGPTDRESPAQVTASYERVGALSFAEDGVGGAPGLRQPQLGAVHAVLGYWTMGRAQPATVVMPTGTGKTETMLALLIAARPSCLLVMVPSQALREQVAQKFERLGVLQELGIVASFAHRPVVGRMAKSLTSAETAAGFAAACNVIVATPNVLAASTDEARTALLAGCSHLFVDEAHHVAARTWTAVREAFENKPVVQFTATPFREDGKQLQGRQIYAFPLRKAQEQGYFEKINYTSVIDFVDVDRTLATLAVNRLREDLALGFDHLLMARVDGIPKALALLPLYEALAADLKPVIVNSQMPKQKQLNALAAMRSRSSLIIICVDMLGEGFDLPSLKVAAVHDPRKSLGVTLQFIGRFARTSTDANLGEASVFVARRDIATDKSLRALYAEDADWNVVLQELTESAVQGQQHVSDFEAGFTGMPDDVTLRNLLPKMSTVVYQTPTEEWEPLNVVDFFGEENLFTVPIGYNPEAGVAWCVVERATDVRWGDLKTVEEVSYELFILYFDRERRLLYINSSGLNGVFQDLADAVVGTGSTRFTGTTVYRVMADIGRLTPTNVGVLDVHDQFRRFSMHVGSDVSQGFTRTESQTKVQTNISVSGWRDGSRVNISASLKGRIWTHATAASLKHWCDWCNGVGDRLLDDSISIDDVIGNFLLPKDVTARPMGVLLAAEWPPDVYVTGPDRYVLHFDEKRYSIVDVDLSPTDETDSGPFRLTIHTPAWRVNYEADYVGGHLTYKCATAAEIIIEYGRTSRPLSEWLNEEGLILLLERDQLIDQGGRLFKPDYELEPYNRDDFQVIDWAGVDLHTESQGPERDGASIQARCVTKLRSERDWDVILDDDGAGEVADLVALKLEPEELIVKLVHCKYSHGDAPGARVNDLYEVCGQANKSVRWRRGDMETLFKYLDRRARRKYQRTTISPFDVGDEQLFYKVREQAAIRRVVFEVVIAQPGLSAQSASSQQLDLLASSQAYLHSTIRSSLQVWCSA